MPIVRVMRFGNSLLGDLLGLCAGATLFGVLMGYLWLDEQTSYGFLLGASLTIVGLLVVNLSKAVVQTVEERSSPPENRKEEMQL